MKEPIIKKNTVLNTLVPLGLAGIVFGASFSCAPVVAPAIAAMSIGIGAHSMLNNNAQEPELDRG